MENVEDPVWRTDFARLHGIIDSIDAAVYEVDLSGWCRFVNRRAVELFGYPEERWLSQPRFAHAIALGADRATVDKSFMECARAGKRRRIEYRVVTADGRLVWIAELLTPVRNDLGEVRWLFGVMRRIRQPRAARRRLAHVQRQLAEQLQDLTLLHELSQRLWTTLDLEPLLTEIVSAIASIQGAEIGLARLYDPIRRDLRIVASVGLPQEYLDEFDCVPLGDDACALASLGGGPVIIGDTDAPSSKPAVREDGRIGGDRAKYSTLMTSRSGELLGALATCFREPHCPDHRQIRLAELFARQAADFVENAQLKLALRDSDLRKENALAALAHELRNPLSALLNAAQVIKLESSIGSRSANASDLIMRQARLMVRLADDLIDMSRAGAGEGSFRLESVEVSAAMAKAAASVDSLIHEQRHSLRLVPPPLPVWVEADPLRLEQMLVNLLTNAARYTDPGGTITLDACEESERVAIRVRDNGKGIEREMLSRVFEPFVRATDERSSWLGGLGLGLALVKIFAERQGGTVMAASDGAGKGSEFVVRLKRAVQADGTTSGACDPSTTATTQPP